MKARIARTLLVLAAALAPASCGYTTKSLSPAGAKTIAVPVFANETYRHDLEFEVTRAVIEEIQARTPLRVVDRDQPHDLELRGTLRDIDEELASRRRFQRIRESTVFVTAEVEVRDRTGNAVVPLRRVTEREAFVPALGEEIRSSRQEATRALAERIVQSMQQTW